MNSKFSFLQNLLILITLFLPAMTTASWTILMMVKDENPNFSSDLQEKWKKNLIKVSILSAILIAMSLILCPV